MPRRLLKFGTAVRSRIVMIASDGGSIRLPRPGVGTWAGSGGTGDGDSGFASSAGTGATDGTRKSGGPSSIGAHCPVRFRSEKITVPSGCLHCHVSAEADTAPNSTLQTMRTKILNAPRPLRERVRVRGKLSISQLSIKPAGNCLPTPGSKATIKGIMAVSKTVSLKKKSHAKPALRRMSSTRSAVSRDLKTALKAIATRQTRPLADVLK